MTGQDASVLRTVTNSWLQRRGHAAPPGFLSKQQKQEFQECFALLDTDKTGRLSVDNLLSAFQLLKIQAHDSDVRALIAAVDKQGSGYINYDSFEAVMARSMLQQTAFRQAADPSETARLQPDSVALPFHEIARAFRRKMMMAEVMNGGKGRQQLLNRHADRYLDDETEGRTMMAMKLHLQMQQTRSHPKQRRESPRCLRKRPPVPTIRLGSIARKLPQDLRLAVANAVAYDPPASGEASARLTGVSTSSDSTSQLLPGGNTIHHMAATVLPAGGIPQGTPADEVLSQPDQASSQQSSQQSSQRSRHHSSFQLPPADHLGASESASSSSDLSHTWQDPSVMTPRQLAVEQLLSRKLHALPSQQATVSQPADVSTPGTLTSPEPDTARGPDAVLRADGQSEAETGRLQGPLPGLPCKPQAWASKYSTEPPRSLVEVGDDGVPLGVFERHSLSPRRSSGTAAPQCHLDSWRLTELRTFRQQQRQKEERETDERAAVADMNGAMLQVDRAEMHMPVDRVPGVAAAAARSPSVQLQRKLTAECMVAEGNAATAGDSAMQGLVSMHSVPFKMPRNRPSMHSVHCPALPAWLRRRSSPAFSIPTSIKPSGDQADRGALAGSCSPGGKGNLEENVWAGIGGLGRNGRSSSIAALQTPRPKALQMRAQHQAVSLPIMASQLWQGTQDHGLGNLRCLCGSGGSLKAAALLTLAGHRCKPMIPHLDSQRATAGKPGLIYREDTRHPQSNMCLTHMSS